MLRERERARARSFGGPCASKRIPVIDHDCREFPEHADTTKKVEHVAEAHDRQAYQRRDCMQDKQHTVLSKLPNHVCGRINSAQAETQSRNRGGSSLRRDTGAALSAWTRDLDGADEQIADEVGYRDRKVERCPRQGIPELVFGEAVLAEKAHECSVTANAGENKWVR